MLECLVCSDPNCYSCGFYIKIILAYDAGANAILTACNGIAYTNFSFMGGLADKLAFHFDF